MIKITNDEMRFLTNNGFKFHDDIHKTYSGNKNNRYYATESPAVLNALDQYRSSKTIVNN